MTGLTRRALGGFAAASGLAIATSTTGASPAAAQARGTSVPTESKSLDQLYHEAVTEGGGLVVYAGGDAPTQNDGLAQAFRTTFPAVGITTKTDLSKYHDARIDNQLTRNRLEPDVAQLQTLQDFDRWKRDGERCRTSRPVGTPSIHVQRPRRRLHRHHGPGGRVPDQQRPGARGPVAAQRPRLSYLDELLAQRPTFVRGLPTAAAAVSSGAAAATIAGVGALAKVPNSPTTFTLPAGDFFQSWAQTAAIFAKAKHPAAAKLYLNWVLSKQFQQTSLRQWSVRRDVLPPADYRPLVEYRNTSHAAFRTFMTDRAGVERFKSQIELYVGAPQGPNPAGTSGPLLLTS